MTKQEFKVLSFQNFLTIKEILIARGSITLNIVGKSMLPLINEDGKEYRVYPVQSAKDLKRFDIIVYWSKEVLIAHYFWRANKHFNDDPNDAYLITRPLNPLRSYDHPIKFDQILGIITEKKISLWSKIKIYFMLS